MHELGPPQTPFTHRQAIRFSHCDPGGIVHFPRFFDMINAAVEDWFALALELPFDRMHMERRYEVHTYPGTQHGFHNDATPRYNETAAKLAWNRTVAFFKKNLA